MKLKLVDTGCAVGDNPEARSRMPCDENFQGGGWEYKFKSTKKAHFDRVPSPATLAQIKRLPGIRYVGRIHIKDMKRLSNLFELCRAQGGEYSQRKRRRGQNIVTTASCTI